MVRECSRHVRNNDEETRGTVMEIGDWRQATVRSLMQGQKRPTTKPSGLMHEVGDEQNTVLQDLYLPPKSCHGDL